MKRILALLGMGSLCIITMTLVHAHVTATTVANSPVASHPITRNSSCQQQTAPTIVVSIHARRLWACQNTQQIYTSAVITGDMNNAANLTPVGNYTIYAKQSDHYLKGSDSKGSWNEHVDYWMSFLYNQYGAYGFHDAAWRQPKDFGAIDPFSTQASHGCVELPSATSKWLYSWSQIGTKVVIKT